MPANRVYKDSVFSLYLSQPERLVEVYNAVAGTNYPSNTPVQINTLEDVLWKEQINDKTTPRLIQFHTLKNAANPPFLGVFSIFGTVAA